MPPVVPWLVSLLYRVVGHDYFAAVLLQCVIGACAPLLTAALGAAMFGASIGLVAAVLVAVDPLLVFFGGQLLPETTFTVALLAALSVTAEWVKTPRPGRALGAGLLWGAAALTRPAALALPLIMAAWAWVPLGLTVAPRDRLRQVALLLAGVAIVVAPWAVRNTALLGRFVPVQTGIGRALLEGNNDVVWGDPTRRGGAAGLDGSEPWASRLRGRTESEADAEAARMAWAFLTPRLGEWPAMAAAKLGRMWRFGAEPVAPGTRPRSGSALERMARRVDPFLPWFALTAPFALVGLDPHAARPAALVPVAAGDHARLVLGGRRRVLGRAADARAGRAAGAAAGGGGDRGRAAAAAGARQRAAPGARRARGYGSPLSPRLSAG